LQAVHEAAAAGFVQFVQPLGAFDDEQAAEGVPVRPEGREQFPERADGADDEGVVAGVFEGFFGTVGIDGCFETELLNHVFDGAGLFANAVAEGDTEIGANDGQDDAWDSAAGADVENFFPFAEVGGELQRIEQVAADEFFVVGVAGEVDLLVPVPEQAAVFIELLDVRRGEGEVVAGEGGGERVVGIGRRWRGWLARGFFAR